MQYLDGDAIFPEILVDGAGFGVVSMGTEGSAPYVVSFTSSSVGAGSVLSSGRRVGLVSELLI